MANCYEKGYKNAFKDVVDLNQSVVVNLFSSYSVLRCIPLVLKTACKFTTFVNQIKAFANVLLKIL